MYFNYIYKKLIENETNESNIELEYIKKSHDSNISRLKRMYLLNKDAEDKKYALKKKAVKDRLDKNKRSNLYKALQKLSS